MLFALLVLLESYRQPSAHAFLTFDHSAIDTPSPAHSHLFLTMKDGTTLAFDLARRNLSPYKIPNAWAQHQDRLRRSGVPGKEIGGRT